MPGCSRWNHISLLVRTLRPIRGDSSDSFAIGEMSAARSSKSFWLPIAAELSTGTGADQFVCSIVGKDAHPLFDLIRGH